MIFVLGTLKLVEMYSYYSICHLQNDQMTSIDEFD